LVDKKHVSWSSLVNKAIGARGKIRDGRNKRGVAGARGACAAKATTGRGAVCGERNQEKKSGAKIWVQPMEVTCGAGQPNQGEGQSCIISWARVEKNPKWVTTPRRR